FNIVDHYTYSLVGDGDIMEGITHEAASLAGHLGLGKLIVLYDSNDISLDGDLDRSFSDDTHARFEAYNWLVIRVEDGNELNELEEAHKNKNQPTLIEIKTVIGCGSPNKSASSASHGAPLGEEEAILTKANYKWPHEPFDVPEKVYEDFKLKIADEGAKKEAEWNELLNNYSEAYPELAKEFNQIVNNELPKGWEQELPTYEYEKDELATRAASSEVINSLSNTIPQLFGGSADLASSNNTMMKEEEDFTIDNYAGRNIWFGVREFAMGA